MPAVSKKSPLLEKRNHIPWIFLLVTVGLSQLFPEYLAPEFTLLSFVVMKVTFSRTGQKVKMGQFGKFSFIFMCYMMIGVLYSDTKLYSMLIALLWMGMFLGQMMIVNLVDTRQKLITLLKCYLGSAMVGSVFGLLQMITYQLSIFKNTTFQFPNPVTRIIDDRIFPFLVERFNLQMNPYLPEMRACGTFSNPNLFAAFLVVAFPIAVYFFLQAKTRRGKIVYALSVLLICGGVASTQTRGALIAVAAGSVFLLVLNIKRFRRFLVLLIGFLGMGVAWMIRSFTALRNQVSTILSLGNDQLISVELEASVAVHFQVYRAAIDIIFHNFDVFLIGLGPGVNNVWALLRDQYGVNQPHAHNIFLELWLEGGIIGLGLFCFAGCILVRDLVRVVKQGGEARALSVTMLAGLLVFFVLGMTDYILCSPKILQVFFFLLGFSQAVVQLFPHAEKRVSCDDIPCADEKPATV